MADAVFDQTAIQAFAPGGPAAVVGQQPRARSDSNGVSAGPACYVVAGYDGTVAAGRVPDRRRGWPAAGGLN